MSARARSGQSSKKRLSGKPSSRAARTTVLHLCADLEPGDPGRGVVDLAILTQRAGWRALIVSGGGLLVPEAERAAVQHTRMPLGTQSMFISWRNRARLTALVQKERPVLIHAHGVEAVLQAFDVVRARRLPLVADFTKPLPNHSRMRRFFRRLGKISCAVRVPSEYMARQIGESFKWPANRLKVIPPGIDTQWHNATSVSAERLQGLSRLWRLPEQASIVVMPMPFVQGGGHKQFLEALKRLKRDDVFAVLAGDNRPARGVRKEIETLIGELGLDGKIVMPDYCLDWPAACWLSSAVVAVNDAPRGQATELLVAQALGRPVIVSDCGANREMVADGKTAWAVPPDNAKALAKALSEVIGLGMRQRLDLAHHARDFVVDAFPQANWFNATMELYDSLLIPAAQTKAAA